jgi:hypothetical protein
MKVVYLEGLLMDNNEFICHGKSMWLTEEEIKKFVKEKPKGDKE